MNKYNNLQELFAKLDVSLNYFETDQYLISNIDMDAAVEIYNEPEFMYAIGRHINQFDTSEALELIAYYQERIKNILENLRPVEYYWDNKSHHFKMKQKLSAKFSKEITDDHKRDLNFYQDQLEKYKNVLSKKAIRPIADNQPNAKTETIQNVIQLPENFSITDLKKTVPTYTPLLKIKETAYFLHYLRKMSIIPPYNGKSLTIFGKAFLAKNDQNIRKVLAEIGYEKFEREKLENLKLVIEKLLEEINQDLK